MTPSEQLKEELTGLQALAFFQRGLRLGLRALWLGGAGFLLAWGVNALWGWLPDSRTWILAGLLFSLLPLVALALSLSRRSQWAWKLDRRLGLQEQVSTALEVAERGGSGELSGVLVAEVLSILPGVRERMLRRGWFLERDLVAALIVLLLGGMVIFSARVQSFFDLFHNSPLAAAQPVDPVEPFPRLIPTPTPASSPQPENSQAGQPGIEDGSGNEGSTQEGPASEDGQQGRAGDPTPGMDPNALGEALRELGGELSQQAPTYDLGQALQELDLEEAAGELEELAEQLDDLSPETRERLAEALEEAAEDAGAAGDPSLSEDLRDAAEALQGEESGESGPGQAAGESLDQLAQDLRDLAQSLQEAQANQPGAGSGSSGMTGRPEPAERLQGEGGDLELPLDDSSQSGMLSPAPPQAGGDGTAGGERDAFAQGNQEDAWSPLVPNAFLWKWRDVVSSYFQR